MEAAGANARYVRLHEERPYHDGTFTRWAEKQTDDHPYHFKDGVTVYVSGHDHAPDDDFLVDRERNQGNGPEPTELR